MRVRHLGQRYMASSSEHILHLCVDLNIPADVHVGVGVMPLLMLGCVVIIDWYTSSYIVARDFFLVFLGFRYTYIVLVTVRLTIAYLSIYMAVLAVISR